MPSFFKRLFLSSTLCLPAITVAMMPTMTAHAQTELSLSTPWLAWNHEEQSHLTSPLAPPLSLEDHTAPVIAETPTEKSPKKDVSSPDMVRFYGPTDKRDTLWGIAEKARPSKAVTIPQAVLAIYRLNRESFEHQNIHELRPGSTLRLPSAEQMRNTSVQEAEQVIRQHQARLNGHWRNKLSLRPVEDIEPRNAKELAELQERNQQLHQMLSDVRSEVTVLKDELNGYSQVRAQMDRLLEETQEKQTHAEQWAPQLLDRLLSNLWVIGLLAVLVGALLTLVVVLLFLRCKPTTSADTMMLVAAPAAFSSQEKSSMIDINARPETKGSSEFASFTDDDLPSFDEVDAITEADLVSDKHPELSLDDVVRQREDHQDESSAKFPPTTTHIVQQEQNKSSVTESECTVTDDGLDKASEKADSIVLVEEPSQTSEEQSETESYTSIEHLMAELDSGSEGIAPEDEDLKLDVLGIEEFPDVIGDVGDEDVDMNAEAAGKLDLAQIYMEMNDLASAQSLLEEAAAEGDVDVQREAQRLLAKVRDSASTIS